MSKPVSIDAPAHVIARVEAFASENGRLWRSKLRALWQAGTDTGALREARNYIGPSGLDQFKPGCVVSSMPDPEPFAAPPAAPVASDPVPADVPAYLAVSTDGAGVETVMGVFRVAEHASADAAEMEAGKLCERIERAAPGAVCHVRANPDVNGAFFALAKAEAELHAARDDRAAEWARAFDKREAARERAVSLDPVRFVRTYPSQAYAFRHLLPADMVARIEAAEDDAELRAAVGAPAMVPQVAQQQQAKAGLSNPVPAVRVTIRDNACRAEYSAVAALPTLAFEDAWRNAPRAGWATDAREAFNAAWFHYADNVSSATRGDATVTIATEPPAMVPQPCQPQQACAVRVTFQNANPDTIWNKLAARLRRQPSNAEAAAEVKRILRRD